MIGYVTVGTNDLKRAGIFYDEVFGLIDAARFMEEETYVAWATSPEAPGFAATKPFDGNVATVGNGTMVAIKVDSTDKVKAVHEKALALGGSDEGAPGDRGDGFYAGYFRDLDGNKLNVFCMAG